MDSPAQTDGTKVTSILHRHRIGFSVLLLMLAAFLLYLPSVHYGFVDYDDGRLLLGYPELFGQSSLSADLNAIFISYFPREEPLLLRDVFWAIESRIFGFGNPVGYHLGNVILHSINVGLLFIFLYSTTRRYILTICTTAAFLILAVHTEPVAWIMGRKDILSTFFMLLALVAQTRRIQKQDIVGRWFYYFAALVFTTCAMFSKINALSFPLVLFLHAIFFPYVRGDKSPDAPFVWGRKLVRELLLMLPYAVVTGLIFLWYRGIIKQGQVVGQSYSSNGWEHLWTLLVNDPPTLWVYLRQTFFPKDLSLFYQWPSSDPTPSTWQVVGALGTILGLIAVGIWLFRKHKDLFFYFAVFFALMIPYMNFMPVPVWMAERYLYFSAFCLLALAVAALEVALKHEKSAARLVAVVGAVAFIGLNLFQTFYYQPKWRNPETLWQYHLSLPNPHPTAFENLAAYYYRLAVAPETKDRAVQLRKMKVVLDAGFDQFWRNRHQPPPSSTWYLFFLKSLTEELGGDLKGALNSLLTSYELRHPFDPTSLNLARLYRRLAEETSDPKQQEVYARASHERFLEYIANRYPGRSASAADQEELRGLEQKFPFLIEKPSGNKPDSGNR